jgi:hypothetical protein
MSGIVVKSADGKGLLGAARTKGSTSRHLWVEIINSPEMEYLTMEERKAIKNSTVTTKDHSIFVRKIVGVDVTAQIFDKSDKIEKNIRNIADSKLAVGKPMVVNSIRFRSAELTAATTAALQVGVFKSMHETAIHQALQNGTLRLKVGTRTIYDELPLSLFVTKGRTDIPEGMFELEGLFVIPSATDIEATITLGTSSGLTATTAVELQFDGSIFSNV